MFARPLAILATMVFVAEGIPPAAAAGPLSVSTKMLVEKRVAAVDGTVRTELSTPTKVVPGDRITIVLTYRNNGVRPIADLMLANQVPRGMVFRAAGPGSPAPELSVDGRNFAGLATLQISGPEGVLRPATADDIIQVRWRLPTPVMPGAGGELTFLAVLK